MVPYPRDLCRPMSGENGTKGKCLELAVQLEKQEPALQNAALDIKKLDSPSHHHHPVMPVLIKARGATR